MTYPELQRLVKDVQYRPGFTLTVALDKLPTGPEIVFRVSGMVTDAYNYSERELCYNLSANGLFLDLPHWDEERVIEYLWSRVILRFETHEAGEFFRVRGRRPFDPHRPGGTL